MQPDVRVHVEHLVLEGIDPSDRYAVAEALQAELGRVLGERGVAGWLPASGGAVSIDAGELVLPRHAGGSAIGTGAGAHVARALTGAGRPSPERAP